MRRKCRYVLRTRRFSTWCQKPATSSTCRLWRQQGKAPVSLWEPVPDSMRVSIFSIVILQINWIERNIVYHYNIMSGKPVRKSAHCIVPGTTQLSNFCGNRHLKAKIQQWWRRRVEWCLVVAPDPPVIADCYVNVDGVTIVSWLPSAQSKDRQVPGSEFFVDYIEIGKRATLSL